MGRSASTHVPMRVVVSVVDSGLVVVTVVKAATKLVVVSRGASVVVEVEVAMTTAVEVPTAFAIEVVSRSAAVVVKVPTALVVEVMSKSGAVELVLMLDVEICFQAPQSGQPPSDKAWSESQLLKASFMPVHPSKLSKDATPIAVAARQ